MSIHNVKRIVDTVIIEMDISTAEQLQEILTLVQDDTIHSKSIYGAAINDLRVRLEEDAEVRYPSPLYRADAKDGYVLLRDIRHTEREAMRR